jgi:hypothetical protein
MGLKTLMDVLKLTTIKIKFGTPKTGVPSFRKISMDLKMAMGALNLTTIKTDLQISKINAP